MNTPDSPARVPPAAARPAASARRVRAARRTPFRAPCRVRLIDPATGEVRTVIGETLNISSCGMALQLGASVPLGTWVETMVSQVGGEPLFLCGTVVNARQTMTATFEIGVETDKPRVFV